MAVEQPGLDAIADQLIAYLDSAMLEKRAIGTAAQVRFGQPLRELARQDEAALLMAAGMLDAAYLPASTVTDLMAMVDASEIDANAGIQEIARLAGAVKTPAEIEALFVWLSSIAEPARGLGFDQWGEPHVRAMAAIRGMNQVDGDWPEGYEDFRVPRADPEIYRRGRDLYNIIDGGCTRCHGEHGQGEGVGVYPQLAHSPWVLGDPQRPATIVQYGLKGTLTMPDGRVYHSVMEPVAEGGELDTTDVAAILTYIRQSWGNYAAPVSPAEIARLRKPKEALRAWEVTDILAEYPLAYDTLFGEAPKPPVITIAGWNEPPGGLFIMLGLVAGLNGLILLGTIAVARAPI